MHNKTFFLYTHSLNEIQCKKRNHILEKAIDLAVNKSRGLRHSNGKTKKKRTVVECGHQCRTHTESSTLKEYVDMSLPIRH